LPTSVVDELVFLGGWAVSKSESLMPVGKRLAAGVGSCSGFQVFVQSLVVLVSIAFSRLVSRRIAQQFPMVDPVSKVFINIPSFSSSFIQSLGPPFPPYLASKYSLPDSFTEVLRNVVDSLPSNPRTGRRQLMFTVFTHNHITFAMNLLCSQLAIRYDMRSHLYIALDQAAFHLILSLTIPAECPRPAIALLERDLKWRELCRLKLVIHYTLLTMNVETTSCDDDIVFYQDPSPLFDDDTDLQVGSEGRDRQFHRQFEYNKLNSGFFRVVPNEVSLHFYHSWTQMAIANTSALGQIILAELVEPFRDTRFDGSPRQYYRMDTLLHRNEYLRITWFDPLAVPTAKLFHWERTLTLLVARRRGIRRPFIFHAAWLLEQQKPIAFAENGLWLIHSGTCTLDTTLEDPWPGPSQTPVPLRAYSFSSLRNLLNNLLLR
jgi:hypothetical protein